LAAGVLGRMVAESGARGVILTDEAGMMLHRAGDVPGTRAETLAVLAVNAFVAAREAARLAGVGVAGEFWQRGACGGYGVLSAGPGHRLVVVYDAAHAEGAVAFGVRGLLPRLQAVLAAEHEARPPVATPGVAPFAREAVEDSCLVPGDESSWKARGIG
jgi:hypothetical protein